MRPYVTSLLAVFVLLLSAFTSSAQKIRFVDTSNTWQTSGTMGAACQWDRTARLTSDTIMYGNAYKKLNHFLIKYKVTSAGCNTNYGKGFFIREDANTHIVYYRMPGADNQEHILYNYNLNQGDTIQYPYSIYPGGSVADSVVALDSILISGIYHRVWDFQSVTGRGDRVYSVIEGVGCTNHPAYPAFAGACNDYFETLKCFAQSGLVQDFSMRVNSCATLGSNFYTNCDYYPLTTAVPQGAAGSNIRIYPNPSGTDIHIDNAASDLSVAVYDLAGRCIFRKDAAELKLSSVISTTAWANGTYVVVLRNQAGIASKETVIINH